MARRSNSNVPYAEFDRALEKARQVFPGADDYKINWHMGNVYVEVWNDGHAKVHLMEENVE